MAENKKKVYLITFKCDCILGECAQIINDECGLNDLGYRLDFEQKDGNLSTDTKKILFTSQPYDITVTDTETNESITEGEDKSGNTYSVEECVESVEKSWVEKKLKLKSGSRYYIQGFQTSDGTFTKKISCKIETEGAFDANKLSMIYDDKFYELHCSISNNEAEGCLCDMIVPDEDIFNPYELYYDGKKFKCNKFRIDRVLKGESYMTFEWN